MFDCYWSGGMGCIFLEVFVFVVNVSGLEDWSGGVVNVVVNVVILGVKVIFLGMCGYDENVCIFKEKFSFFDINCEFFEVLECDIIIKFRVMSRN